MFKLLIFFLFLNTESKFDKTHLLHLIPILVVPLIFRKKMNFNPFIKQDSNKISIFSFLSSYGIGVLSEELIDWFAKKMFLDSNLRFYLRIYIFNSIFSNYENIERIRELIQNFLSKKLVILKNKYLKKQKVKV